MYWFYTKWRDTRDKSGLWGGLKNYLIRQWVWQILQGKKLRKALRKRTGCFSRKTVWGEWVCAHWYVCDREPCFVGWVYFICLFVLQKGWQFVHQHISLLTSCKIWIPVHVCKTHKRGKSNQNNFLPDKERTWTIKNSQLPMELIKLQDIRAHSALNLSTSYFLQVRKHFVFCKDKSTCCPWKTL